MRKIKLFETRKMKYRTKLILFFLLSTSIVILSSLYLYLSSQIIMWNTNEMLEKNLELSEAYSRLQEVQNDLELYLSTSSSDSLIAFYGDSTALNKSSDTLLSNISYSERGMKIKNAANMLHDYLNNANDAIEKKRGRNITAYTAIYEETVTECDDITNYMEEIMSRDVISNSSQFGKISVQQQKFSIINNILIVFTVLFVIGMIALFSFEVTKPITTLAGYARRIASGDFNIKIPQDQTSQEMQTLYHVFGSMVVNIKEYVNQIQEKRRLEQTLSEEKLTNLRMKNALRESELKALQSQVNPHFIFNTINIGSKIAMLQGDHTTCRYLENAADIFRYNLNGLDTAATLEEEVSNVVSYMYLLQTRFSDMIRFKLVIDRSDKELMGCTLPRMTLQPLIENAYIHGIGCREEGGTIGLKVEKRDGMAWIEVSDDGCGISEEKIHEILSGSFQDESTDERSTTGGHTTGLGLDNVLQRLRIYFNKTDVMSIKRAGGMTRFTLILPLRHEKGWVHVSSTDR